MSYAITNGCHRLRSLVGFILLAAICLPSFSASLSAQSIEPGELKLFKEFDRYRYLPKIPGEGPKPEGLPEPDMEISGDPTILADALVGLVLLDDPEAVSPVTIEATGIEVRSSKLRLMKSAGFQRIVRPYLGQPISIRMLNTMIRDIIVFYRKHDRPIVDVSIPRQEITNGVVQLVVTEGRIGKVRVEGSCYFDNNMLLSQTFLCPGSNVYESAVMEDLEWLARDPFRDVTVELRPGDSRGLTDVVFKVDDELPFRPYLGYEDTGNIATGRDRTFYGFNWFDAFGTDDNFNYQYTTDSQFSRLHAHSFFYSKDLQNRDNVTLYGSYAEFKSVFPGEASQESSGFTWQLLLRYTHELEPICDYEHNVIYGYDFKRTNTNLDLGGISVFDTTGDISQLMMGYQGSEAGDGYAYYLGAEGYFSPGTVSGGSTGTTYRSIRDSADPGYAYLRSFFEYHHKINDDFEAVLRATGQLSEGNLLPTEVLGIGGYNSVRGYDFYSVVGDSGYFVNAELWTRPITFGDAEPCGPNCNGSCQKQNSSCCSDMCGSGGHSLRFLTFFDAGNVYDHTPLPGADGSRDLMGVGLGMRYQYSDNVQLRTDYGWQLKDLYFLERDSRFHVGLVLSL